MSEIDMLIDRLKDENKELKDSLKKINDLVSTTELEEVDIWEAIEGNKRVTIKTDVLKQIMELSKFE